MPVAIHVGDGLRCLLVNDLIPRLRLREFPAENLVYGHAANHHRAFLAQNAEGAFQVRGGRAATVAFQDSQRAARCLEDSHGGVFRLQPQEAIRRLALDGLDPGRETIAAGQYDDWPAATSPRPTPTGHARRPLHRPTGPGATARCAVTSTKLPKRPAVKARRAAHRGVETILFHYKLAAIRVLSAGRQHHRSPRGSGPSVSPPRWLPETRHRL